MKKSTKIIIVLLILALALSALAACRRDDDETDPPPIATPADPGAAATPAPTPEATPEPVELLNRHIRIICWWQYMPNSDDPQPDPAEEADYMIARMWRDNQMRIEEEFGVTFEVIMTPWGEIPATITTGVLAGAPVGDMAFVGGGHQIGLILGDVVLSAERFASPQSDLLNARSTVIPAAVFQDRIWSFTRVENGRDTNAHLVVVNLDLLEAIGGPDPVAMWERGEWTWDAWRGLMELALISQVGGEQIWGLSGNPDRIFSGVIASNDGMLVCPVTFTYAFDHPNTVTALEFLYDIFAGGFWQPGPEPYTINNWTPDWNRFREGRALTFIAATWAFGDRPDFAYTPVPFPQGPNGVGWLDMGGFPTGGMLLAGVYNPFDVYMLYEELMKWQGDRLYLRFEGQYSYLRDHWLTEACVQRAITTAGNRANIKFEIGFSVPGIPWTQNMFARHFFEGTLGVMGAVETYRGPQQGLIDDFFADR